MVRGGTWIGCVEDYSLVSVGDYQDLADDFDAADFGVQDGLAEGLLAGYLVLGPEVGELGAAGQQVGDQTTYPGVVGIGRGGSAEVGRGFAGELAGGFGAEAGLVAVQEALAQQVALSRREGGEVGEEGGGLAVPGQYVVLGVEDDRGDVQAGQHPENAVADVGGWAWGWAGLFAGQAEEVGALVVVEAEGPGQAGEDRAGRARGAGLFQAGVVVGGHGGEGGDLLATEARCTAAEAGGQADIGGGEALSPYPEELCQLCSVHASMVAGGANARQGLLIPGSARSATPGVRAPAWRHD